MPSLQGKPTVPASGDTDAAALAVALRSCQSQLNVAYCDPTAEPGRTKVNRKAPTERP